MGVQFSKNKMRLRGIISLLLIAIIGAVFVTAFNSKNSDISYLSKLNQSFFKLTKISTEVKELTNQLETVSYQLEAVRAASSENILVKLLSENRDELEKTLKEIEEAQNGLSNGLRETFNNHPAFGKDLLWPEKRLVQRLAEVKIVQKMVMNYNFSNFLDLNHKVVSVEQTQPYRKVAQLVRQPLNFIVPPTRPLQKAQLGEMLSTASYQLKWWLTVFILAGLSVLAFIAFAIFWPLDSMINRQMFELERTGREVQKADRAKSEFLANMSHEIRTPMNGVMGMAELLAKTELDAKQKTFTDIIVKSGASLLTIINDILDFSKIDAGQMELDPAPFKLAEAIEDVATLVSSRVSEKDLELIVRVDPNLPTHLIGDVGRIRQIVTNLMGNAVKFTDNGHVFVDVSGSELVGKIDASGNKVYGLKFKVEDTGVGIPTEKCDKIFEKFSQVDSSATRKHEGTGLGLAISSSLVKLMGGKIGVESEENVGSTFWFALELPQHIPANQSNMNYCDVSGSRVLIVDDNEVNRSILTEQMEAWKFDSAAAVSGKEALQVMKAANHQGIQIDAVVLDYHMPDFNGGQVVKAMRQDPNISDLPIIMLTSVEFTEEGKTFSSLGVQGHITKPARSSMLLECLTRVISENNSKVANTKSNDAAPIIAEETQQDASTNAQSDNQSAAFEQEFDSVVGGATDDPLDILVCEDNAVNQIVFTQTLQQAGYDFKIAPNGKVGVEYFKAHGPQIILMDVSMPEMNGLEATKTIRELEKGNAFGSRDVVIIGVTAHAIKGDRERCLEAGMDDYLAKPISPDLLLEKISKYLDPSISNSRLTA